MLGAFTIKRVDGERIGLGYGDDRPIIVFGLRRDAKLFGRCRGLSAHANKPGWESLQTVMADALKSGKAVYEGRWDEYTFKWTFEPLLPRNEAR